MRLVLTAALAALAACQPATEDVAAAPSTPSARGAGSGEPGALDESLHASTPVMFEPLSRTAEAFTGAILLSALPPSGPDVAPSMMLTSSTGLVYRTELLPGGAEQAGAVDWQAIFGPDVVADAAPPPGSPSIDFHVVLDESVAPNATNGGLCGADRTFGFAMATGLAGAAGPMMSIAAFRGDVWPPEDDAALCGTFNYAPPR